jgi:hypothetical protein
MSSRDTDDATRADVISHGHHAVSTYEWDDLVSEVAMPPNCHVFIAPASEQSCALLPLSKGERKILTVGVSKRCRGCCITAAA